MTNSTFRGAFPSGAARFGDPASPHALCAALAVFVLVAVVATTPWWRDGLIVPWDAKNHFYPMLRWLATELHAGRWPVWMAETYGGRPALPDPQSMILSPSYLMLAALDPEPSMRQADMIVMADLMLGGAAVIAFGWVRGIHPAAGLLAALVFAFGGAPIARLQHVLLVQSYAWTPIVLLAIELAIRRPTLSRGAAVGLSLGLLVIGRDHVALLGLFVVTGWGLVRVAGVEDLRAWSRQAWPALMIAILISAAIAVPPVLATLAFAAESNRPEFSFARASQARLPFAGLMTLFSPDYFGQLLERKLYWGPSSPVWGGIRGVDRVTCQIYAGLVPAVMLIWLGLGRGWIARSGARFVAVAILLLLFYSFGSATPAFRVFYDVIPGLDLFRRPSDATFPLNLAIALGVLALAGRYLSDGLAAVPRSVDAVALGAGGGLVAVAIVIAARHDRLAQAAGPIALSVLGTVIIVAVLIAGARGSAGRRLLSICGLVALTAVDLSVFGTGTWINAQPIGPYKILAQPQDDPVARHVIARVAEIEAQDGPVRVEILGLGGPWQNAALVLGVEDTLGYNPLRLARYDIATGSKQNSHANWREFGTQMTGWSSPLADLLGLRLIVLGLPMEDIDPVSAARFAPPTRVGNAWIYENPNTIPRAILIRADRTRPNTPGQVAGTEALPPLDWHTQGLVGLSDGTSPVHDTSGEPEDAGTLALLSYEPGEIRVSIDPATAGYVVFHELRVEGWHVTVDGIDRSMLPANGLFQAVAVGPGDREVLLRYRPAIPIPDFSPRD